MSVKEQYEYNKAYQKEYIQRVVIKFNKRIEQDQQLYEHLQSQGNMQRYIKSLIKADMSK